MKVKLCSIAQVSIDAVPAFVWKPCDLQCLVILIRPEPGHGVIGQIRTQHVAGGQSTLILSISPCFQTDQPIIVELMREGAAIAGGENIGVAGAQPVVGLDTVLDGKARIPRQSDFRDGAHAGNDAVADDARFIGQYDGVFGAIAFDPLDTGA